MINFKIRTLLFVVIFFFISMVSNAAQVAKEIESVTVTIKTDFGSGSGVVFKRDVLIGDKTQTCEFVLTAAHVITGYTKIPDTYVIRRIVPYVEKAPQSSTLSVGRIVNGNMKWWRAKLICKDDKTDLALLVVMDQGPVVEKTTMIGTLTAQEIGNTVWHCGTPKGQYYNSIMNGIISRTRKLIDYIEYDQLSMPIVGGCSGGGVFVEDDGQARLIGIILRADDKNIALMCPLRNINKWAEQMQIMWLLHDNVPTPSWEVIGSLASYH